MPTAGATLSRSAPALGRYSPVNLQTAVNNKADSSASDRFPVRTCRSQIDWSGDRTVYRTRLSVGTAPPVIPLGAGTAVTRPAAAAAATRAAGRA